MSIERTVIAFAGTVVTVSALLGWFVSPWWLLLTLFVGLNLLQSSFTGFCPLAWMLRKGGLEHGDMLPRRAHEEPASPTPAPRT
ncbi:MAG: DUF2892 domain-containing protein [Myxococcales bacterium]|nr:DUF2892 domain-containing protein [Myxococcales bacterium]